MNLQNRREKGNLVEKYVRDYLEKQGMEVVKTNFTCRFGEVDIIAQEDSVMVFVEVRSRWNNPAYTPEESVTPEKTRRMYRVASYYLQKVVGKEISSRFDLVTVTLNNSREIVTLNHLKGII